MRTEKVKEEMMGGEETVVKECTGAAGGSVGLM